MKDKLLTSRSTRSIFIFFDYARTALLVIVFLLLFYYLVFQIFVIKGVSMEPNFQDGELMLIDRISYYFKDPARGDSIVFVFPGTNNDKYIKRIIGLPGEEVSISAGEIRINGGRLKEDYIPSYIPTLGDVLYKLKGDQYLVLGDNRELSNDSRIWGPLNREDIIGKAQAIVYPLSQKRYIERRSYNI